MQDRYGKVARCPKLEYVDFASIIFWNNRKTTESKEQIKVLA